MRSLVPLVALTLALGGCAGDPVGTEPRPTASTGSPAPSTATAPADDPARVVVTVTGNPVGLAPDGSGGAWVVAARGQRLTHLAADGEVLAEHPMSGTPLRVVRAYGDLWVTRFDDGTVVRVEESTGRVAQEVTVGEGAEGLTAAYGRLWVVAQDAGRLVEVDPRAGRVARRVDVGVGVRQVTAGGGGLLVSQTADGTVLRVDPRTGRVRTSPASCNGAQGMAVVAGTVWVSCTFGEEVLGLDPVTLREVRRVPLPGAPDAVVDAGGGRVAVVLQEGPTVVTLDARTGDEVDRTQLSESDQLFDQGNDDATRSGRHLWVSSFLEDRVSRVP